MNRRGELMEQVHDLAKSDMVGDRGRAVATVRSEDRLHAVELTAVLLPFQGVDHLFDKVVYVEDFQFHGRVIDRDRKVICDVVAERGDGGVVVRTAPFAVEVREAVHKHLRPSVL